MRGAKVALALLLLIPVAAGCAGDKENEPGVATVQTGTASPPASPTAAVRGEDMQLKFAQCMRANGLAWFPDPDARGRLKVNPPAGVDPKEVDAAHEDCKQFSPEMANDGQADPERLEASRKMAKCMRENGVPNFPDPQPNGAMRLEKDKVGVGPGDPVFDQAEQKCAQFLPEGLEKGTD